MYISKLNSYIKTTLEKEKNTYYNDDDYYKKIQDYKDEKYKSIDGETVLLSPLTIRFSQKHIHYFFDKNRTQNLRKKGENEIFENTIYRNIKHIRESIDDFPIIEKLKDGTIIAQILHKFPIIKIIRIKYGNKNLYMTLDNRRLYILQYIARLFYPKYILLIKANIIDISIEKLNTMNAKKINSKFGSQNLIISKKNQTKIIDTWSWYKKFKLCKYQD